MIYHDDKQVLIRDISTSTSHEITEFIKDIDRFMGEYTDSSEEIAEAVDAARQDGYLIEALHKKDRVGVLVLTKTPFELFQPAYHLAYIAVSPDARGLGLGKLLLTTARDVTEDNIALHVEPANDNAIKFYEAMGWKINYVRMMPQSD